MVELHAGLDVEADHAFPGRPDTRILERLLVARDGGARWRRASVRSGGCEGVDPLVRARDGDLCADDEEQVAGTVLADRGVLGDRGQSGRALGDDVVGQGERSPAQDMLQSRSNLVKPDGVQEEVHQMLLICRGPRNGQSTRT